MNELILRSFVEGFKVIKRHASLLIPIALFLLIERLANPSGNNGIKFDPAVDLITFTQAQLSSSVLPLLILFVCLKAVIIYISNLLILPAYLDSERLVFPYSETIKNGAGYVLFSLIWYILFFIIGILVTNLIYISLGVSVVSNAFIGIVFVLLFPIFYAGISVFPFLQLAQIANLRLKNNRTNLLIQLYVFYSVRSLLDLFFMIGVPFLLFVMVPNTFVGIVLVFCTSVLFVTYIRSVAVSYKSNIFLDRADRRK